VRRLNTNPRDFCREPGYDTAILLTYTFDALFFERIVLPDLWVGDSTDVHVIADLGQINEALPRWVGQARQLGQKYRLTGALSKGAFHPKIVLRSGPNGAAIWIGSGNVTNGGWGCNLEVGTAWRVGPGLTDSGGWLRSLMARVATWLPSGISNTAYQRILDSAWLQAAVDTQISPVLVSYAAQPLAGQLSERWQGRKFDQALIVTGSTDENGAMLEWIHQQFGITSAKVLIDPEKARFDVSKIANLQIRTELLSLKVPRSVHAKFCWFDGEDGPAAVMGSANCSRAAWLSPPEHGGNLETVLVYDYPSSADFIELLSCFGPEDAVPAVLIAPKEQAADSTAQELTYSVAEISWDRMMGDLTVTFVSPLPVDVTVVVFFAGERIDCEPLDGGTVWAKRVSADFFPARVSAFAEVAVSLADGSSMPIQRHWVNDLAELRHSAKARAIGDAIRGLSRPYTSSEQQKLLTELQRISIALLTESALFPDPLSRKARSVSDQQGDGELPQSQPVDPEKLIRSIDEAGQTGKHRAATGLKGVTLVGVMRAIFEMDHEDLETITGEEYDDSEGEPSPGAGPGSRPKKRKDPIDNRDSYQPPERLKERLRKAIDNFVKSLGDSKFAEGCTLTQFVQAAAYPLAVLANGVLGGWIDENSSQAWTSSVFDILFCKTYPRAGEGLIATIQKRCETTGETEAFRQIVGDGTLWTAMLASLWKGSWNGANGGLRKAFALRSVLFSEQLLASADAGRMSALVRNAERVSGLASLVDAARRAADDLMATEGYIKSNWDRFIAAQIKHPPMYETGDVLYSVSGGWAFVVEQTEINDGTKLKVYRQNAAANVVVKIAHYLNVTAMSKTDGTLASFIDRLRRYGN
jgi:hypothetical protein